MNRPTLRRRAAVVAVAAAGFTLGGVLPAQAAPAPPEVVDTYVTPVVVLGIAKQKDTLVAAAVRGTDSVSVSADRTTAGVCAGWQATLDKLGPEKDDATVVDFGNYFVNDPADFPSIGGNGCAGRWKLTYTMKGEGGTTTKAAYMYLLRATRFVSMNSAPEPIRRGTPVTTKAVLQRASWVGLHYNPWVTPVKLQFRTTGAWKTYLTLTPSSTGLVKGTVKQKVTGCWRLVATGTSTSADAVSPVDCVTVR